MQINDLRVEMYNKVAELSALSNLQLLSELCILDKKDYFRNINCFDVVDRNSHRSQLYVSKAPNKNILNQIIFLKESPKILYLRGDSETLVLEQRIEDRLHDYIIYHDQKQSPYIAQTYARSIMMDLIVSLEDFLKHKLIYDCISPKNVVRVEDKWLFSTVGLIFNVDHKIPEYTNPSIKDGQKSLVYSLGALLFKMIFGFPYYDLQKSYPKSSVLQTYRPYFQHLETVSKQKQLKIYYYIERMISVSPLCLKLLQESLSGKLTLQQWKQHDYFTLPFKHKIDINEKNRELKMINYVQQKNLSLVMSAVDFKKKYPLQKLNPKPLPTPQDQSYQEIVQNYRKNYLLRNLSFSPSFQKKQTVIRDDQNPSFGPIEIGSYFYQDYFDAQEDYPCRQLLKLLEKDKQNNPEFYKSQDSSERREQQLKLYAYPYAIAFQLLKVQKEQPIKIRRTIKKSIQLLLQLSNLNRPKKLRSLHDGSQGKYRQFSEMKTTYRENINQLYRYFLSEAMRKYNAKKDVNSIVEKLKKKQKGLEYYRLCLKLLEASLIVRKNGSELNLGRIQTSQRKEIEKDLEDLLKNYFPTKAEIH